MTKRLLRHHLPRLVALAGLSSILATSPILASSGEEQMPVGPRPLAMGGAFTALAEGPDALYWNPAGLAELRLSTLRATSANLHGLGIDDQVLGLCAPLSDRFGVGLEWYRSDFGDDVFEDALDRLSFGFGTGIHHRVRVGAAVRYRQYQQSFGGEDQGRGSGFGLDLGVLARPWQSVRVGASLRDIGGSELAFDDGTTSRPYEQVLTLGAAVHARPWWTISVDAGRDLQLGTEFLVHDLLALRAGWRRDLEGLEDGQRSFGFGLRYGPTLVEYAFQDHASLDPTHRFGIAIDFSLAPRLVDLREARLDPLFASFYKSYAREHAGELIVHNTHDAPVEITVRLQHPTWMPRPSEQVLLVRPGVAERILLQPLLDETVLRIRESTTADFRLEIRYTSNGRTRTERRAVRTVLYEPGTLMWGEGVERAAAFVTPTHDAVATLARDLLRATEAAHEPVLNRTVTTAARLFAGLTALGFVYTPDPLNPFASVQGNPIAVDDIQYPVQLLASRRGDCDDTTVLVASLFESVGIRTALLDVPGHILMMFDTGLHERERTVTGFDPSLFAVHGGSLWIPVETTALGGSFHEAWSAGADLVRRWTDAGRLAVVDVLSARGKYEAAVYGASGTAEDARLQITTGAVAAAAERDLSVLAQWRTAHLDERSGRSTSGAADDDETLALARVYFLNQDYPRARRELDAIPRERRDAAIWNNLGASLLATNSIDDALTCLHRARELDPADPGIALNRGLAMSLSGDEDGSARELARAARTVGGVAGALDLLGVRARTTSEDARADAVGSLEQYTLQRIESMLQEALQMVPESDTTAVAPRDPTSASTEVPTVPTEASETEDPASGTTLDARIERAVPAGHRGEEITSGSLATLLYWKTRANPTSTEESRP